MSALKCLGMISGPPPLARSRCGGSVVRRLSDIRKGEAWSGQWVGRATDFELAQRCMAGFEKVNKMIYMHATELDCSTPLPVDTDIYKPTMRFTVVAAVFAVMASAVKVK